ncbi:MAG: ComEC/Rec2 family competence protein [Mycoplasmataceae bacterium]|nr:ComEC/Rec2 family competence protein [Mycoplasmataceae bacterium]
MFILKDQILIEHISQWIDKILHFSIKNVIQKFATNHYDSKTGSFINLVMFNVKIGEAKNVYHDMIDLSIVYLIVVSGFHISILKRMVKKCFKHIPICGDVISILLIVFYCYLLNFATSVTRVLLMSILTIVIKKWVKSRFDILTLSGLVTIVLGPSCVFNIGFCMSYLCTVAIIYVYSLQIKNLLFECLLVNVSATIVSLPFVLSMSQSISIWTVINSYVFSYVFAFIFVYFICSFWIIWIAPVQAFIVGIAFKIIEASWLVNVILYEKPFPDFILPFYYLGVYLSIRMLKFI